jgi:hypothetical protein
MTSPTNQDNDELREAIERIWDINYADKGVKALTKLFRDRQLQLITELEGEANTYTTVLQGYEGKVEAVPLSVLKHKKQELERGK